MGGRISYQGCLLFELTNGSHLSILGHWDCSAVAQYIQVCASLKGGGGGGVQSPLASTAGCVHLEDVVEGLYELSGQQLLPAVVAALHDDGGYRPPRPPPVRRRGLYPLPCLPKPASIDLSVVSEGALQQQMGCNEYCALEAGAFSTDKS